MEKLLKQPILNKAMPDVVVNFKQYETAFEIVDNMREGWQGIKVSHNLDEMRAKNVVSNMVVSSSAQSLTVMGQLIGTNWRILRRGQSRKI
jgi:CheY-specific phosphatase CheX